MNKVKYTITRLPMNHVNRIRHTKFQLKLLYWILPGALRELKTYWRYYLSEITTEIKK